MSRVPCQTAGTRNKKNCFCLWIPDETIGFFGKFIELKNIPCRMLAPIT